MYGAWGETPSSTSGPACSATRLESRVEAIGDRHRVVLAAAEHLERDHRAQAELARRSHGRARERGIDDGRCAAAHRLQHAEPRERERIALGLPGLALDVDVEPGPERQPVAEPSEARVLEVRVEVDESGREHAALQALDRRVRVRGDHGGCRPDLEDRAIGDRHGTVSDGIRVDRDDPVGAQHERPAHEAPATGSFSAARPRRTSISRATQIDASYSTSSGRNSSSIETGSTPGSSAAIAASTTIA